MDIFEDYLRWRRHTEWLRLDGNYTADARQDMLTKFNAPNSPYNLFILSTRAGGLGLNLQVADTVIIFDSDWNPHQDLQAQDRAHRIGQKNEVRILRLITSRSIEETILQRAQFKLDMDGKVIQAGKFDNKSSAEEREAFLRALIEGADDEVDEDANDDGELNDDELNQVLARSAGELTLFKQIDEERSKELELDWQTAGPITLGRAKNRESLMQEEELPDLYRREHEREDLDDLFDSGRGRRAHKEITYDDGLTDEQFLNAVETGTLKSKTQRAQARMLKKRAQKAADGASDSEMAEDDVASLTGAEDDVSSVVSGSRKRGRPPREASEGGDEKMTKKQRKHLSTLLNGLDPLEIKDVLPAKIRRKMSSIMDECFGAVQELTTMDEDGQERARSSEFWNLPQRKQYPDFYKIVKRPISLEMIQTRTKYPYYTSLEQFRADMDLLFANACSFYSEDSSQYQDAVELRTVFHAKYDELSPQLIALATGDGADDEESDGDVSKTSMSTDSLSIVSLNQIVRARDFPFPI